MNICVFCSSSNAIEKTYFKLANELGLLIGKRGYNLVYGGSNVGLMEELAKSVKLNGGRVTGVIPELIYQKGLASDHADEMIVTLNMSERKATMTNKADAFIVLPGGFGTLEEAMEVLTLKQLQVHHKAIVWININNFFDSLFDFFDKMYSGYFAKNEYRSYYHSIGTASEAIRFIENYTPPDFRDKWYWVDSKAFGKKK